MVLKLLKMPLYAIGGKYKDQPVGSCNFSDITVFSFHPVKIITTGEGGIAQLMMKKLQMIWQSLEVMEL